jgi:hypothetical protein
MRKLYFTTGSPFARAVRIVLQERGLEFERDETFTTPSIEARAQAARRFKCQPSSMAAGSFGIQTSSSSI